MAAADAAKILSMGNEYIFLGVLPFLGLLLTIASLSTTAARPWDALMRGSLIWAGALVLTSNILSALALLRFPWLLAYWTVYGLFFAERARRAHALRPVWPTWNRSVRILAGITLLTLITALVYPPTTFDSMTYHMSKVAHWWQNGSLAHYYTSNTRQTGFAPFAELAIFHSFVLSGGDHWANLVQWSAFIGILCVSAGTASLLGAGAAGQTLAALFFAALPMGIAQASSTQTDQVAGFWLACLAARFLIWRTDATTGNAAYFGMALGLAILTKGTGYVISLPFVLAFAFFSLRHPRQGLPKAVFAGCIALILFMPHLYRNYTTYRDPFLVTAATTETGGKGSMVVFPPTVQSGIAMALANILSNIPLPFAQDRVDRTYEAILAALGIKPDDPALFSFGPVAERRKRFSTHESQAQNPVHVLLLLCCLCGMGVRRHAAANSYRWYVLASVALFCLLFNWNRWILRIQLPLFALAAPLAGFALEKACGKKTRNIVRVLLILYSLPVLFGNWSRPLLPPAFGTNAVSAWTRSRDELYFTEQTGAFSQHYMAVADILVQESASSIGLVTGGNAYEYPLWALLRARCAVMPRIRHVIPPESPDGLPATPPNFEPQYLFVLERRLAWEQEDAIAKTPLRLFKRINGVYTRIAAY